MTEITLKNDPKQKCPKLGMTKQGNFASWIAFLLSHLKKSYKQTCNNSSGQTYTQATGLISLL
ncbi:Uncharacterised protein (plasmid) [Klebsiella aerogenes]|nr:Uncharacterised protein [Klebsiella aerogenes]